VSFFIPIKLILYIHDLFRFVNIFFREERLPIAEGWKRSETPINGSTIGPLYRKIQAASNWTAGEDCHWLRLGPDDPIVDF